MRGVKINSKIQRIHLGKFYLSSKPKVNYDNFKSYHSKILTFVFVYSPRATMVNLNSYHDKIVKSVKSYPS